MIVVEFTTSVGPDDVKGGTLAGYREAIVSASFARASINHDYFASLRTFEVNVVEKHRHQRISDDLHPFLKDILMRRARRMALRHLTRREDELLPEGSAT